eukprot:6212449-Lingulodinium_polyedra.AAC.1
MLAPQFARCRKIWRAAKAAKQGAARGWPAAGGCRGVVGEDRPHPEEASANYPQQSAAAIAR